MWLGGADETVAQELPCASERNDLKVLGVSVANFPVASLDLVSQPIDRNKRLLGQRVHAIHQGFKRIAHDKVLAFLFEGFDRRRRAFLHTLQHLCDAFAGQIRVLLRP